MGTAPENGDSPLVPLRCAVRTGELGRLAAAVHAVVERASVGRRVGALDGLVPAGAGIDVAVVVSAGEVVAPSGGLRIVSAAGRGIAGIGRAALVVVATDRGELAHLDRSALDTCV